MTLEEIKERRAELVEYELDSDIMEMFCWLIGEVERLQQVEREAPEVITCVEHQAMLETAQRCAQIADITRCGNVPHCVCSDAITLKILDEFGLEE